MFFYEIFLSLFFFFLSFLQWLLIICTFCDNCETIKHIIIKKKLSLARLYFLKQNRRAIIMQIQWYTGAAPGSLLRGGGGECLATAARAQKFCASPEKVVQWGGGGGELRHIFFLTSKIFHNNFHNGVGGLSWPWPTAELTSKKKI